MVNKYESSIGYLELNSKYKQLIFNIDDTNNGLNDAQRQDFYDHVKSFDTANGVEFRKHCETFFLSC